MGSNTPGFWLEGAAGWEATDEVKKTLAPVRCRPCLEPKSAYMERSRKNRETEGFLNG